MVPVPDERADTYVRFFRLLQQAAQRMHMQLAPKTINIDFEIAVIEAVCDVMAITTAECDVLHVNEALMQEIVALSTFYLKDHRINTGVNTPTYSVSTTDKQDANALPVNNATNYVREINQTQPYDGDNDVAIAQDARVSLNDGTGSNVDDDSVNIAQINAAIRKLCLLENSGDDEREEGQEDE